MAESYSVKAVLSVEDRNFSMAFEKAGGVANALSDKLKGGLGFGVLAGIGQKTFDVIAGGITGVVGELNSGSKAWKTFDGNMAMLGKSSGEIASIKTELQGFATQSIYSASDMASTFAQLEAVGTKNTKALVKGFGGLAAAAENPKQAMKTLSQQATQMAAKPMVAWQDFKLMMEQTPAGVAAVAKEMGKTANELVADVQNGTVKTEDFFDAISKVGTNDAFTKLATTYKSVDEAVSGLTETVGVQLTPAFDALSSIAISGISGIINKIGEFNPEDIANKVMGVVNTVAPYWVALSEGAGKIGTAFMNAVSAVGSAMGAIAENQSSLAAFSSGVDLAAGLIAGFFDFIAANAHVLIELAPFVLSLAMAFKAMKVIASIAPGLQVFSKSLSGMAKSLASNLAPKLFGTAAGQKAVGKTARTSSKSTLAMAKSTMMLGVAVLTIAIGFSLLAYSAIALADSGGVAIGVMAGLVVALGALVIGGMAAMKMFSQTPARAKNGALALVALGVAVLLVAVGFSLLANAAISLAAAGAPAVMIMVGMLAAIVGLAIGAAAIGPALTAGAVGFIAFGLAIALVGVGALLAATALTMVAGVLPILAQHGLMGAVSIAALGVSMVVFAAGAAVAGVASVVLGAGLIVLGAGILVAAAGALLLSVAVLALGAGLMLVASGATLFGVGLQMIAVGATQAGPALLLVGAGTLMLAAGAMGATLAVAALAVAFGGAAITAGVLGGAMFVAAAGTVGLVGGLLIVQGSLSAISSKASGVEKSLKSMVSAIDFVEKALGVLGDMASSAMAMLINAFRNAEGEAKSAGQNIGNNVKKGIENGVRPVPQIASTAMNAYANAVRSGGNAAIAASTAMAASVRASLASAGDRAYDNGYNIGAGLASGMYGALGEVRSAAAALVAEADRAIRAKAQIHSPSRLTKDSGVYFGEGFAVGIESMFGDVMRVADKMVRIPELPSGDWPMFGDARGGRLNEDYHYTPRIEVSAEVTSVLDGRKVGYGTAKYSKEKNDFDEKRANRIGGVV